MPWTPSPPYYDIGGVFAVNGLSPQGSFKQPPARFAPRPRNNKRNVTNNENMGNIPRVQHMPVPPSPPQSRPLARMPPSTSHTQDCDASSTCGTNGSNSSIGTANNDETILPPYRPLSSTIQSGNKDAPQNRNRPRRRRDDELPSSPLPSASIRDHLTSRGSHFDLEAAAFPPLPGLDVETPSPKVVVSTTTETSCPQPETSSQWCENRLADVVKGTVKSKIFVNKEKEGISSPATDVNIVSRTESNVSVVAVPVSTQPPPTLPPVQQQQQPPPQIQAQSVRKVVQAPTVELKDVATSSDFNSPVTSSNVTTILTPPSTPEKLVPALAIKCTMADKSTKTDESLLNGELIDNSPCPTTTNAATMTTPVTMETNAQSPQFSVVAAATTSATLATAATPSTSGLPAPARTGSPISVDFSNNSQPPRMSYAQVAQHNKERLTRDRCNSGGEQSVANQSQQTQQPQPQQTQSRDKSSNVSTNPRSQQDQREHRESRGM